MAQRDPAQQERGAEPPDADSLLGQVLRGERTLLFPPGTWAFVSVQVLLMIGSGLLAATLTTALLERPQDRAIATMAAIALLTALLVTPGVLLARGIRPAWPFLVWIARLLLLVAVIVAVSQLGGDGGPRVVFASLSACIFAGALLLLRSRAYAVVAGFYRAKREHELAQRAQRGRRGASGS